MPSTATTNHASAVPAAAARLRASLDAIASALQSVTLDALLAAELELSSALTGLARVPVVDVQERAVVRGELARARAALSRCRMFGSALEDAAQSTLVALGCAGDYNRAGGRPTMGAPRATLRARV